MIQAERDRSERPPPLRAAAAALACAARSDAAVSAAATARSLACARVPAQSAIAASPRQGGRLSPSPLGGSTGATHHYPTLTSLPSPPSPRLPLPSPTPPLAYPSLTSLPSPHLLLPSPPSPHLPPSPPLTYPSLTSLPSPLSPHLPLLPSPLSPHLPLLPSPLSPHLPLLPSPSSPQLPPLTSLSSPHLPLPLPRSPQLPPLTCPTHLLHNRRQHHTLGPPTAHRLPHLLQPCQHPPPHRSLLLCVVAGGMGRERGMQGMRRRIAPCSHASFTLRSPSPHPPLPHLPLPPHSRYCARCHLRTRSHCRPRSRACVASTTMRFKRLARFLFGVRLSFPRLTLFLSKVAAFTHPSTARLHAPSLTHALSHLSPVFPLFPPVPTCLHPSAGAFSPPPPS
ncbi:unnamed protein product [Closterium sp. Naga37s-1]|nr:unnamed protein product [Closterium sp. Naga37s-1]